MVSPEAVENEGLRRVGSIVITASDLEHFLEEKRDGRGDEATRVRALEELVERARLVQAALDAGLGDDAVVRAETARVLASRLRESELFPRLKGAQEAVAEVRLREIYQAQRERFIMDERRRVAVLWLDPGKNPERAEAYREKMGKARDWMSANGDAIKDPAQGFGVLSVDYSEHAASRFRGGMLGGSYEEGGGGTDWERAVVEVGFSLGEVGEVSEVTSGSEGVFLVRLAGLEAGKERSFESVRDSLEREEQRRRKQEIEEAFEREIRNRYP